MENKERNNDELLEIARRFEQNLKLESPKRNTLLVNKVKSGNPVKMGSTVTPKPRTGSPRPRGQVTESAIYVTSSGFKPTNTHNFPNQAKQQQNSKMMMEIPENTSQSQVNNLSWKSQRWDTTTKSKKVDFVYLKPTQAKNDELFLENNFFQKTIYNFLQSIIYNFSQ